MVAIASVAHRILPFARALAIVGVFVGAIAFALPLQTVLRALNSALAGRIQQYFCRLMCGIIGIRVMGDNFPSQTSPTLIAANHVSWTDIIALASITPITFLAKSEVATWPLLGFLARSQGTLFVTRGDRRQISSVNAQIAEAIRGGANIALFPEGTSTAGIMNPRFNSSHFEITQLANFRVTPVGIFYSNETGQADVGWYGDMDFLPHLWGLLNMKGFDCHILFGDPVFVEDKGRKLLASEAQEQVHRLLSRAKGRHNAVLGLAEK